MTIYDANGNEITGTPEPHRFGELKGAENTRLTNCSAVVGHDRRGRTIACGEAGDCEGREG